MEKRECLFLAEPVLILPGRQQRGKGVLQVDSFLEQKRNSGPLTARIQITAAVTEKSTRLLRATVWSTDFTTVGFSGKRHEYIIKEMKPIFRRDICTPMSISEMPTIAEMWNPPNRCWERKTLHTLSYTGI